MVHRRRVRIAALVAMSCWLVPQWTIGQIPVPEQFGKVYSAPDFRGHEPGRLEDHGMGATCRSHRTVPTIVNHLSGGVHG